MLIWSHFSTEETGTLECVEMMMIPGELLQLLVNTDS